MIARIALALALFVTALAPARAFAAAEAGEAVTVSATVQSIDLKTREVVLKGEDGKTATVVVPEEIANLAIFLLSDLCPWQTGDCVTMDGGEWLAGAGEFSDYRKVPRDQFRAALDAMKPKKKNP